MAVYATYDQARLDWQYNNRARVPDFQDYIDRWTEASAKAREVTRGVELNVAYGPGPREKLDVFSAGPQKPVLVFIHGGYWRSLDKDVFSFLAPALNAAGISAVLINYPLAPAATMDEIVATVRGAFVWLAGHGGGLGLNIARMHVAGHSAGGHLAAMVMSTDWSALDGQLPADLVKGGCAISGLYDLEPIRLCYLNEDLHLDMESARRNSPIHLAPARAGPLILTVGGLEPAEYQRQQRVQADAWRTAGHSLTTVDAPGLDHFSIVDSFLAPNGPLLAALLSQMDGV